VVSLAPCGLAQTTHLTHGAWEIYVADPVSISAGDVPHGDPSLYRYSPPIPPPGPDWKPLTGSAGSPRNPIDIDYLGPHDDYSSDLRSCLTQLEFTCFEAVVQVPAGFETSEATLTLGPLDDGARVLVINPAHPAGVVPDGGYILLGDNRTLDLSKLLQAGASNRIVVQHLDDCAGQSWLGTVQLEVSGGGTPGQVRPTWGRLKAMYH
jgi:hypothetical protein